MNPNDEIRRRILQYFYNRNASGTSRFGKKGSAVKISDAKRGLKERDSLSQQQVVSNLTYLIDNGWVKTFEVEKTVRVKGGTVPSTVTWYEITAAGIDKIEGGSQFEPKERYAGINITATGRNIIALGDGNVVNAHYSALYSALDDLKATISRSDQLTESDKLALAVDIESIKDQLAKEEPNKTVIGHLWSGLQKMAILQGVAAAYERVAHFIAPLIR